MPQAPTWDQSEEAPSWDDSEETPSWDQSTAVEAPEPTRRRLEPGEPIPEVGGGLPPRWTDADTALVEKQSALGGEIAGTMAQAFATDKAARVFEPNLPRNILAPTSEEALKEGAEFRAANPEFDRWNPSPLRPPSTVAELSPNTRESLAAGEALSGTVADLSSADQALVLGGAAMTGGVPGAAGRILGGAVPATFGVEGVKSIVEGAKTLMSDDATPEQRGGAKAQIGLGATMLPGFGALMKRPAIPPRIVEAIAKGDQAGLTKATQALADTARREIISDRPQQLETPIEKGIPDAIREPTATEGVLRQERPEVELQGVREPQVEAAIPREPARAQGGEESQVLLKPEPAAATTAGVPPAELTADIARYNEIQAELTKASKTNPRAFFEGPLPKEKEAIKNKYGGYVPVKPPVKAPSVEKFEVSVQAEDPAYPGTGFVQIVDTAVKSENVKSPTVESLRAAGMEVPDFSKLPTGKYTWKEAIEKANLSEQAKSETTKPVSRPTETTPVAPTAPEAVSTGPVGGEPAGRGTVAGAEVAAKPETIKTAAVRGEDGTIYTGKWHPAAYEQLMKAKGITKEQAIRQQQDGQVVDGFVTSEGRFVDRNEAATIASNAKQFRPDKEGDIAFAGGLKGMEAGPGIIEPKPAGRPAVGAVEVPAQAPAEIVGMGGARAGVPVDPRAQLAQLTDSIATLAREGKSAPSKAFDLGRALSQAKETVTSTLDGLKAAGQYMKLRLEGKPVATEYRGVLGDRHLALSESSVNARRWMKDVKKAVPDPLVREAISDWVDTGGDPALLTKAASETKAQYKAGYERAQKLTPEEKVVAENLRNYFDSRLQEAIDAGVLEDGIENYIHRAYEAESPWKKGVIQELRSVLFTGQPALAKKRIFEYDFEAEKLGKKPVKDFAQRVAAYDLALNKSIADRAAVKAMMEIKMSDGRPMIDVGGGGKVIDGPTGEAQATLINRSAKKIDPNDPRADRGDFKPFDHPALRKWKWATEDTAGKPIFVQGDVLIHPEAIKDIRKLLEPSAIRRNPVGRSALGVSSTIKQTMLDLSLFHQVQIAVHALEHRTFGPVKEIDFTNPDVRGLVRGGAVVGETSGAQAFSEGLHGSSLTKHIPWVGERISAYKDYLFSDFIPRIKVAMGLHALERNRSRFKNLSQDELYQLTANQMNAAFGELNYEMMGRSKTMQDALRLGLLAPDFLEARGRFTAQAGTVYGGLPHFREGKFTIGEQGNALLLGAATMYIFARMANKFINDEYHFELKNAFNVIYKGKSYGLRTVQGDLIHAATDPGKFVNHRLNPLYGKPALEFATGRDYFGRKRDAGQKLQDLAMTPIPIAARGVLSGQEQTLLESFLNSIGAVVKRDSPSSDMALLAEKFKKDNKIATGPGEFIYDAEKDPYRPIKLAAERDDEAGARSEIAKAINEGMKRSQIIQHFKLSEKHRFAGSVANERKFLESLTEDQKKIYQDAKSERRRIRELVMRALP